MAWGFPQIDLFPFCPPSLYPFEIWGQQSWRRWTKISRCSGLSVPPLFDFPFVKEVFISENYVSISKVETVDWFEITNDLRTFLKNYIEAGKPIVDDSYEPSQEMTEFNKPVNVENLDNTSQEIVAILDEYIKPAVTSDGGNIMFQSYDADNKTVNVILQGACSGCPSSTITLKNGIEATLKQLLPNKIEAVIAING